MKRLFIVYLLIFPLLGISWSSAQEISPYINVGDSSGSIEQTEIKVISALQEQGFDILGKYTVGNNEKLSVIVYSREDIQNIVLKIKDRGLLAGALKIGLKENGSLTKISYLNPEYLFQAYLRESYDTHSDGLQKIEADVTLALSSLGSKNEDFGGSMSSEDLREYHYKIMMPYFSDPVELMKFSSFEEGVKTIEKNLQSKKGHTEKVYTLKFKDKKVAVYGVALLDPENGEHHFLPIIGEDNLAAMPYEIILENNVATMLHGRYRLALHWPELSMGTFMKIRNTPGDIKDTFEELCK